MTTKQFKAEIDHIIESGPNHIRLIELFKKQVADSFKEFQDIKEIQKRADDFYAFLIFKLIP